MDLDIKSISSDFDKRYCTMLQEFSVYKSNKCQHCTISHKITLYKDIKLAITDGNKIDWMGQVTGVWFYKDNELWMDLFSANIPDNICSEIW